MSLRDFLGLAGDISSTAQSVAGMGNQLRQDAAKRALIQQAPELMRQGRLEDVAALAADAGDMTLLRELMQQRGRQAPSGMVAGPGAPPSPGGLLTAEQIEAASDPSQIAGVGGSLTDPKAQSAFLKLSTDAEKAALNRQREGRLTGMTEQTQRKDFASSFDKLKKEWDEQSKKLATVKAALEMDTLPSNAIVVNFLARDVAGEKGVLSDKDREQFLAKTAPGVLAELDNYINGRSKTLTTPEQKAAFKELIELAEKNFNNYRDEQIGSKFATALTDYPRLFKDGKPDPAIVERTKKHKYQFDPESQSFKKSVDAVRTQGNDKAPSDGESEKNIAMLVQKANMLPSGAAKNSAIKKISEYDGRPMPKDIFDEFNRRLDALLKGK